MSEQGIAVVPVEPSEENLDIIRDQLADYLNAPDGSGARFVVTTTYFESEDEVDLGGPLGDHEVLDVVEQYREEHTEVDA